MTRRNKQPLAERVANAAEAALAVQGSVCAIDVLMGIRWIDGGAVARWQTGELACLEEAMSTNPERIAEALSLLHAWAEEKGLVASPATYLARSPERPTLRFSRDGQEAVEALYRSHWLSPALPEKKRQRLAEKANRAPELVVIQPLNKEWRCHRCAGSGDLLIMEPPGPACLRCAGLDDLEFLPAGDHRLTRRAKVESRRYAVVVRFSRTRRRYERQGLLVERDALAHARGECDAPSRGEDRIAKRRSAPRRSAVLRGARTPRGA